MPIDAGFLGPRDLLIEDEDRFVLTAPSFRKLKDVLVGTEKLPYDEQSMRLWFSDRAFYILSDYLEPVMEAFTKLCFRPPHAEK
ncbi:uncharacterized protein DSM5745_07528 [Aspergillus mulundensis]|uniref:Uncharacterized protein n=1 Tax=Aspergillus mulundensis TaxID=1810919 RepID=A0A3D8REJ0_9EURO|nr:hypothetical protein DSM5745_07528 [Aspergillus mulundensis]RDW72356.1 hypothetical protein DSM5745_07528 [Aspergillus mulundensis]